jgi:hypothetical protein
MYVEKLGFRSSSPLSMFAMYLHLFKAGRRAERRAERRANEDE